VNARATRGVDQMRRGRSAANEQSSITLASPYRMYLFFLSGAPSLLLALGPLCFEQRVGRSIHGMSIHTMPIHGLLGWQPHYVWIIESYRKPGQEQKGAITALIIDKAPRYFQNRHESFWIWDFWGVG
jgi:hypothetical protein